jgi:outer membrane lipoprotein carrier protein
MRMGLALGVAFTLLAGSAGLRAQGAGELAEALQKKYESVRDFSADFVHTYRGGVLRKELSERGELLVRKPGKFRWRYTSPEEKLFVSDGTKVYSYVPQDKQVIVTSVPPGDSAASPALFLAGKGNLVRDFVASFGEVPAGVPAGTQALKLVPRTAQPDYDWLVVLVDRKSLALRGLITADPQGGTSSLMFTGLKENVGATDKDFVFTMPRGVDVVTDAGRR